MIPQERKITAHLPKRLSASGSGMWDLGLFHSASVHIANIVSHCSNIERKIAKCNCSILWWERNSFILHELWVLSPFIYIFFSTWTVACDSFPDGVVFAEFWKSILLCLCSLGLYNPCLVLLSITRLYWGVEFWMSNKIPDLTVYGFEGIF